MQTSPQKICLSYTLSVSDYRALQWSHGLYGIPRRHLLPISVVLILLLILIIRFSSVELRDSFVIPLVLIVPLWVIMHRYIVHARIKDNPMFNCLISTTIDEHSYHMLSEYFDYRLWWVHVYRVVEGKRHFYIYESSRKAQILPKNVMTDEQVKCFKQIVIAVEGLDIILKKA